MASRLSEILHEQVDDLATHSARCGRPLCPDCNRFRRAATVLLEPFDDVINAYQPVAEAPPRQLGELTPTARWLAAVRKERRL